MANKTTLMEMAYAIGMLDEREGDHPKIDLGEIDSKWEGYELWAIHSEKNNDHYSLYYNGPFGCEKSFAELMEVREGFTLEHMCHILMQGIDVHQSELRNKKIEI